VAALAGKQYPAMSMESYKFYEIVVPEQLCICEFGLQSSCPSTN